MILGSSIPESLKKFNWKLPQIRNSHQNHLEKSQGWDSELKILIMGYQTIQNNFHELVLKYQQGAKSPLPNNAPSTIQYLNYCKISRKPNLCIYDNEICWKYYSQLPKFYIYFIFTFYSFSCPNNPDLWHKSSFFLLRIYARTKGSKKRKMIHVLLNICQGLSLLKAYYTVFFSTSIFSLSLLKTSRKLFNNKRLLEIS